LEQRLQRLHEFVSQAIGTQDYGFAPASSDASFRRYFRVSFDGRTEIVMDAPPEHENCERFIKVAEFLAATGLNVPLIKAADLEQGFLLISDLGTAQYLDLLDSKNADRLYGNALQSLLLLQKAEPAIEFPEYDEALLTRELGIFSEWYLQRHLGRALNRKETAQLQQVYDCLVQNALEQPRVIVHRDYHSRNLLDTGTTRPGILDFQDAVIGPITYDLVSLLKDCYIAWPEDRVERWACDYKSRCVADKVMAEVSTQEFLRWFHLMGVQRHLKAAGIFARLKHRDAKPGYLADIPRTLSYVARVARQYPELEVLIEYCEQPSSAVAP